LIDILFPSSYMTTLFGKKRKREQQTTTTIEEKKVVEDNKQNGLIEDADVSEMERISRLNFPNLGLSDWICEMCKTMEFRRPMPVQSFCIPAVLEGKDVMGCAETGSGKTAAFCLPILQRLAEDPYGIFAVVLTPTRELAIQISEQFAAFGSPISLRQCVVIGGTDLMVQSLGLEKRPHVIIATPGRLRSHIEGPSPPNLQKAKFLVLDEADLLLTQGFEEDLEVIMGALPDNRQTLLFSATMTTSLKRLESLSSEKIVKYDLTKTQTVPATLKQEYLFIPHQAKNAFLVSIINKFLRKKKQDNEDENDGKSNKIDLKKNDNRSLQFANSILVFAATCRRCQELTEMFLILGIRCVSLHSVLPQKIRANSLLKLKSSVVNVMICTDIASRGLDIPEVDLVINYDIPNTPSDYVHRVGRTARAGRSGRSLSLVSQYDIELIHGIERFTGVQMTLCEQITQNDIMPLINKVSEAFHRGKARMSSYGFDDKHEIKRDRIEVERQKLENKKRKKQKK